ncbi:CRTAC1 family protein [bacterium]|nr:CRTAC1 family protein [candidate division CSSED10-310 bacterium]
MTVRYSISMLLNACAFFIFITVGSAGYEFPFTNVSQETGLTGVSAFRIAIADINGDEYPDLLLHEKSDEVTMDVINKHRLFLNVPGDDPHDPFSRKFIDFTEESGIRANRRNDSTGRHSSLAIFADIDNDGDLDMFTGLYYHRLEYLTDRGDRFDIMLNDGMGHFSFPADKSIFDAGLYNTSSAVFTDVDCDGKIDLYVGNWFYDYANEIWSSTLLFRGSGNGSFAQTTETAGMYLEIPCYAVSSADWNGDGWPDLFTGNYCRGHNLHWRNNGDGTFTEIQAETHFGEYIGPPGTKCSWGSMPCDFDNDSDIDFLEIMTHGGDQVYSCPLVNTDNIFTWGFDLVDRTDDPRPRHHGDHYASWFDIDNDGLSDFLLTECGYENNRLYIFKQEADNTFHVVTSETGLNAINDQNLPPHNATAFDYDLDGDEDIIVGFASEDPPQLWRNELLPGNNWITVRLEGAGLEGKSNRSAIGARVTVQAAEDKYTREVYAGNGHFGPQKPMALHFGLNTHPHIDSLTVHWPNQQHSVSTMNNVEVNQHITIMENRDVNIPEIGVRLQMPDSVFSPGELCWLDAFLYGDNTSQSNIPLFIILEIAGQFWFWDNWSQEIDAGLITLHPGETIMRILPEFRWPDTGQSTYAGIVFWGAMLNAEGTDILGGMDGLDTFEFGFGP